MAILDVAGLQRANEPFLLIGWDWKLSQMTQNESTFLSMEVL